MEYNKVRWGLKVIDILKLWNTFGGEMDENRK
jgi:hypothetical protein